MRCAGRLCVFALLLAAWLHRDEMLCTWVVGFFAGYGAGELGKRWFP